MTVSEDENDINEESMRNAASILQTKAIMSNNVLMKRKEQLHRWGTSEMNNESCRPKKQARVQFQDSDVFLSACMSGDEEEVEQLLNNDADINTCTVDGLTALHQSVIDSKPEMVRFLCEHGADVNAQDNEGWTPLHAAACCGNVGIVKYLCEHGADLSIINSDKELAIDLADDEKCKEFLEADYRKKGVNLEDCRDQELTIMMCDAEKWLRQGRYEDRIHDKTGAHAMHVAAAKGYTQLLELLIKAGGDVNCEDNDGWTPLHAAAHWGEKDSCKILIEHDASINTMNHLGQNVLAVADKDISEYLEELETAAAKKRNSPAVGPSASILHDKNIRVSHEEHTVNQTTEHKRDLQHRDASSENEILHKLPRLESPAPSSAPSTARISVSSSETPPPATSSVNTTVTVPAPSVSTNVTIKAQSLSEPLLERTERTEKVERPDKLDRMERNGSEASRSSSDRSSSLASGSSSTESQASITKSGSASGSQTGSSFLSVSSRGSATRSSELSGESVTESSPHSSSIHSSDQNVSATVAVPRLHQQPPNSWINRGVQLVTRSNSSSSATRSGTASRTESSPLLASSPSTQSLSATYTMNAANKNLPVQASMTSLSSYYPNNGYHSKPHSTTETTPTTSSRHLINSASSASMTVPNSSSTLPWASLYRSGSSPNTNNNNVNRIVIQQNVGQTQPNYQHSSQVPLQMSRVSAFRPLAKSQATSSVPSEFPKSFQPQHLQPHQMRPWVSSGTNESEAERRNNSRLQRQHRRSTQGVTKEQLEEASRLMNQDRQNVASSETSASRSSLGSAAGSLTQRTQQMPIRLASQERDSSDEVASTDSRIINSGRSQPNGNGNVDTSMTLTLASAPTPSHTPSAANMRRRSQAMLPGATSRSNRRGTGPVLPEDVLAASSTTMTASRSSAYALQSANPPIETTSMSSGGKIPLYAMPSLPASSTSYKSTASTNNGTNDEKQKSQSMPPTASPQTITPTAGLRGPTLGTTMPNSRTAGRTISGSGASAYTPSTNNNNNNLSDPISSQYHRPNETNLNYKALWEKERLEKDRMRRELDDYRRDRPRNGVSVSSSSTTKTTSNLSNLSLDESERRALERRIQELELQLKSLGQVRSENLRLKEENAALVRVISKMTI